MSRIPSVLPGSARRGLWPAAMIVTAGTVAATALGAVPASAVQGSYRQINLVSDQRGRASLRDTDLVNAWGLAASPGTNAKPGSPLWVADNRTGKATLYSGATPTSVSKASLVVTVAGADPTGQVFNPFAHAFIIRDKHRHSGASQFIFDTENGKIDGWSPAVGARGSSPSTVTEVAHRNARAVYKGLAIAKSADGPTLYATNFHSGRIEAYNSRFKRVRLPGGQFIDSRLPAHYAPFGIAEIRGRLYVTYAQQGRKRRDDVQGHGHGFVDIFTNNGRLVRRLVTRGALDSPWGLALAPAGFGQFGGDLLVGNFGAGDGHINAYNPVTGARLGHLMGPNGRAINIDLLWGLMFGNGDAAKTNELIFSAGPIAEDHGLLGKIVVNQP